MDEDSYWDAQLQIAKYDDALRKGDCTHLLDAYRKENKELHGIITTLRRQVHELNIALGKQGVILDRYMVCAVKRGARMQKLRADFPPDRWLDFIRLYPDAPTWFDEDFVPVNCDAQTI
jgi:hypothetical protein